jgi:hypothetical protein
MIPPIRPHAMLHRVYQTTIDLVWRMREVRSRARAFLTTQTTRIAHVVSALNSLARRFRPRCSARSATRAPPNVAFGGTWCLRCMLDRQNGCTFRADLHLAEAARASVVSAFRTSRIRAPSKLLASAKGGACIRLRARAVPPCSGRGLASAGAALHEREPIAIVWVCAVEQHYNSTALQLRIGSERLADA